MNRTRRALASVWQALWPMLPAMLLGAVAAGLCFAAGQDEERAQAARRAETEGDGA